MEELLELNIGGRRFTTTRTTLAARGDNFFTALLSGRVGSVRDRKGAYFVDR
jgi:hypothetical protein